MLPATGQRLFLAGNDDGVIGDGDVVNVVPVRNAYNRTGSDAVSVDVIESETVRTVVQGPMVTLPTRSSATNCSSVLPGFQPRRTVPVGDPDSDGADELTIDFPASATLTVYCAPVGIGGASPSGTADLAPPAGSSGGGGSGGTTSADAMTLSSSSSTVAAARRAGELEFTLANGGSGPVTITDVSLDSISSQADGGRLTGGSEFERTDGVGALDRVMGIDGTKYELGTDATIAGGGSATFELKDFRRTGDRPPSDVDMSGESVTIRVHYADGSSEQFTPAG